MFRHACLIATATLYAAMIGCTSDIKEPVNANTNTNANTKANTDPQRIHVINAAQSIDAVQADIRAAASKAMAATSSQN